MTIATALKGSEETAGIPAKGRNSLLTINRVSQRDHLGLIDGDTHIKIKCPTPLLARPKVTVSMDVNTYSPGDKLLPCNKWGCPVCSERLKKQWRFWMYYCFSRDMCSGKVLSFFTLTIDPKRIPEGVEFLKYLQDTWNRFNTGLRHKKIDMKYVSIIEPHLKGNYHMHVIASFDNFDKNTGKRIDFIKGLWYRAGGGCEVRMSFLKSGPDQLRRSIGYVSKYMTKEIVELSKAIKASQGYGICSADYKNFIGAVVKENYIKFPLDIKFDFVVYSIKDGKRLQRRPKFTFDKIFNLPVPEEEKQKRKKYFKEIKQGTPIFKKYEDVVELWGSNCKGKMR